MLLLQSPTIIIVYTYTDRSITIKAAASQVMTLLMQQLLFLDDRRILFHRRATFYAVEVMHTELVLELRFATEVKIGEST